MPGFRGIEADIIHEKVLREHFRGAETVVMLPRFCAQCSAAEDRDRVDRC